MSIFKSSTSNVMMNSDHCFLHILVEEDSKSGSGTKSRGANDSPKTNKSIKSSSCGNSNDCKQCSREYGSENSHANYSEDFISDCSETARRSNNLKLSGTEEKKSQKKKKKKKGQHIVPPKGGKKLPPKKMQHKNTSFLSLQNNTISQKKNAVAQRISSAKLQKIRELKNELFDLQHKLEASNLENQILKELQCRHLKAIGRYENSENNLPDLLARHYTEVRTLRKLLRMSQEEERNTSRKLRKVEAELLKNKDALQALRKLSEDKGLAERDELNHRLSVLTEKIEDNNKRIQVLEKQLKLNNSTFSRQLADENKRAVEAGIITKHLQMEINSLHQKIKEKERELCIRNIYANRMLKIPKDKGDSVPHEKSSCLSLNKSVQVDKQSFRSLLLSQYQNKETEKSPIQLSKKEEHSEDKNQKVKASEAHIDAQCEVEKQRTKKISKLETFNRTCREFLREGKPVTEEYTRLEYMKQEEKKREEQKRKAKLLKQELKEMMKAEQTPLNDIVKKNSQEGDAVEEREKEQKPDKQLNSSGREDSKPVTPTQSNKTPIRLRKQYIFSEATENLHQGLPASGTKFRTGSLCNHRHAFQDCSEIAESKVKNSFGLYEPSFGKVTRTRQKDSLVEAEGSTPMTFTERKNSLMKELFGPSCVLKDNHSNNTMTEAEREK
ncbi:lebercilin-like protein isoform X2 [Struthio camelus]|uniref:lebercilin-like protein isoform X2 n=1 Tax=Struthio camelus TaxID=8801 RepID=UPI003603DB43